MRLYSVVLITWAATVIVTSESNIADSKDEKAIEYTEFRDLPLKQVIQPYVTGIEARSSGQTGTADHSDDATNIELSRPARTSEQGLNGVSTNDYFSSESIYTTPFTGTTDKSLFEEHSSQDTSRYIIPEDVLLIQSAGSFGQKVQHDSLKDRMTVKTAVQATDDRQDNEYVSFRKSFSSTVSPLEDGNNREKFYVSSTREPFILAPKKKNNFAEESREPDKLKVTAFKPPVKNSDEIFDIIRSTTASSLEKANSIPIFGSNVTPDSLTKSETRSHTRNTTTDSAKKLIENPQKDENIIKTTSVEINPSVQLVKFTGPIVVPDLPESEAQDVMVDYMDDEAPGELKPTVNSVLPLAIDIENSQLSAVKSIATSSIMLNPLQVGITLMNADGVGLMDDSEQSAATDTKDYFQDDWQRTVTVDKKIVDSKKNHSDIAYKNENFQRTEKEKNIETVTYKSNDDSVEIQKSIELFHTAPIHEIHYPAEYIQSMPQFGVTETNNIGNTQKLKQPYAQNQESNYDAYRGNEAVEKNIVKSHTSAFSYGHNRQEYNGFENNVGKPKPSTLIAEYSSTHEQAPFGLQPLKYNEVKPVLFVANQFDDTLYHQSNIRQSNFNGNDNGVPSQSTGSSTRQEITSEFVKPYIPSAYQEYQPQPNQIVDQQHFRASETRRPEVPQLLLKIIPNGSSGETRFLVPIPRPYPIEKIVEKTVHVPHPVEIEKVIEKKVPVAVPVPLPVHVQVPIDRVVEKQIRVPHLYPIHIERVIEKRVPYTIQRLLVQPSPYPLHVRAPAAYPTHITASVERPAYAPVSTEKTAEKLIVSSQTSRPYRTDIERPVNNGAHSMDTKFNKYYQRPRETVFGSESQSSRGGANTIIFEPQQNHANSSQFYGDSYSRPLTYDYSVDGRNYIPTTHISNIKLMILPKKYGTHVILRPHTTTPPYAMPASLRRQIVYNLVEKDKTGKDEYVGPVPPRKALVQGKTNSQTKASHFSTSATQSPATTTILRRARQPEPQYPGNFRQSKMEYGFKPPMVPSVQYDEKTASKIEN